ncbi:conserved protein of unknown function [Acidithiobacillus ferrivorans]|uniref:Uncharacterized protein n=1 Tax=Acidithiobacillus ferrivorans TaxID=160808 RepID=A0A060ULK1_9PROT|nr:hypothetical protein [Acidithiobacillus ferrivorans]CDQ09231.1 conserved hypothetical protein [Acidithiobacillus ferrivorans]SMH64902.1 conserved protein of unknown function [Acidithiobacillus ferrivorans]
MNRDDAQRIITSVAAANLPKNTRRYKWTFLDGGLGKNALGYSVDHQPVEGKIIYTDGEIVVLKQGAKAVFTAVDHAILPESATFNVDDQVRITPYSRRRFDGTFLYEPVKSADGFSVTYHIGESVSYLPLDKGTITSQYLLDMIDLLERGKTNSYRTIAQVLIDAGATLEPLQVNDDPDPENIIKSPPAITFRIQCAKLSGYLNVFYDRAMDYYGINVMDGCGTIVDTISDIAFTCMAGVIQDLVDDEAWRVAKVEILQKVRPARKAS